MAFREKICPDCWKEMTVATCDRCGVESKVHIDLPSAPEWMRNKRGWTTKFGTLSSDPVQWICKSCTEREKETT